VERLVDEPIISPATAPSIGENIQGPSVIRVPDWVGDPLGRFYLYFADHKGAYIRLAYADELIGPWRVHPPGSLHLASSCFLTEPPPATPEELDFVRKAYREALGDHDWPHDLALEATIPHIASPDVHVDHDHRRLVMYFHGLEGLGWQVTRAATSPDGITFQARPEIIGAPYLRAFDHDGWTYAITMPGRVLRSADGLKGFESGPTLFGPDMRHSAVFRRGSMLHVLWTRVGDAPEAILHSTIDLSGDWSTWRPSAPVEIRRPERSWEGADAPIEPSIRSVAYGHVNQLRDPAVFEDEGRTYLIYAVAGESGLGLAELHE
jgi:hypothetical protein